MPLGDPIQHKATDPSDTKAFLAVEIKAFLAAEIKAFLAAEIKQVQDTIKETVEHRAQLTSNVQGISDQERPEQRPSATNLQASPSQVDQTPSKEEQGKKRQPLNYFTALSILDATKWEDVAFVYDDKGYVQFTDKQTTGTQMKTRPQQAAGYQKDCGGRPPLGCGR